MAPEQPKLEEMLAYGPTASSASGNLTRALNKAHKGLYEIVGNKVTSPNPEKYSDPKKAYVSAAKYTLKQGAAPALSGDGAYYGPLEQSISNTKY